MKFRLSATIAIYFLFTLLSSTLYTNASQDKNKIFTEKTHLLERQQNTLAQDLPENLQPLLNDTKRNAEITTISKLSISQERQHIAQLSSNPLLLNFKNNILFLIINQFLTCKDILILRKTCEVFKNLLQPNRANMATFCYYSYSKQITETKIIWSDLKYFLKQSYYSAFNEMKMFNIKKNLYAVLTGSPEEKIIVWNNQLTHYPQLLLHQATKNTKFVDQNSYNSKNLAPLIFFNKKCTAWAIITKNGNVTTDGNKRDGGNSRSVQSQLKNVKIIFSTWYAFAALLNDGSVVAWGNSSVGGKILLSRQKCCFSWKKKCPDIKNVKMIFSTNGAFAALLNDGDVVAWGNENSGGKIPDDIQPRLQNVETIFTTCYAFTALLNDGSVLAWGSPKYGGKIPDDIQPRLQNVKKIFSTFGAFTALLDDGKVLAWGDQYYGGQIPDDIQPQLQNVKIIYSTDAAFAALLNDGNILSWGDHNYGGEIPDNLKSQLQNVKIISSTQRAFAALLNDGSVLAWGDEDIGGQIPDDIQMRLQNVKIIFSTTRAFAALLNDGTVLAWGYENYGGKIPDNTKTQLKNVETIFAARYAFAALLDNGNVLAWGHQNYGGKISDNIVCQLQSVKTIIPADRQFTAVCKNGETVIWPDLQ